MNVFDNLFLNVISTNIKSEIIKFIQNTYENLVLTLYVDVESGC